MTRNLLRFSRSAFPHSVVQASALAVFAGTLCLAPASAQDKARPTEAGLRALEVWKGQAFGPGRADFSAGVKEGFDSLGKALVGMFTPKLEDRLELVPSFRSDVGAYSVMISYRESGITILATATESGATIEVTGRGPDGTALEHGLSMNDVRIQLEDGHLRADAMRSFWHLPVGESRLTVAVAPSDDGATKVAELAVVRLDADLKDSEERLLYFRAAVAEGKAHSLSRAIEAGMDVDAVMEFGPQRASAVVIAAGHGFVDAVEVLVRAGADANAILREPGNPVDGVSALLLAINRGSERIVRLLLGGGADPDLALPGPEVLKDHRLAGGTPLLIALARNEDGIARLLIESGADVNRPLPDAMHGSDGSLSGVSPLMLASFLGKAELVDALIEAGADAKYRIAGEKGAGGLNPQTAELTALKLATRRGHTGIANRLKEAGASR